MTNELLFFFSFNIIMNHHVSQAIDIITVCAAQLCHRRPAGLSSCGRLGLLRKSSWRMAWLSDVTGCPRLIWYISCPESGVSR